MILLDENIQDSQRQLLRRRIRARQIGGDAGQKGLLDEAIVPFLQRSRRPSFFTRDLGFYQKSLCHPRYCLVCMAIGRDEVASFVRRFLHHPHFGTQALRLGAVVRVSSAGLRAWRLRQEKEVHLPWT